VELVVLSGPFKGRRIPVNKPRLLFGREPSCEVALEDEAASRKHAELENREGRLLLRDLASTNGTFVNGSRIQETELRDGDRLRVGDTVFLLENRCTSATRPVPKMLFGRELPPTSTRVMLNIQETRLTELQEGTTLLEAQKQFTRLHQFVTTVSGFLHRPALVQRILDRLLEDFEADRAAILLAGRGDKEVERFSRCRPGIEPATELGISRSEVRRLFERAESLLVAPKPVAEGAGEGGGATAVMAVPFRFKDRLLGLGCLERLDGRAFTEPDLKLFTAMGLHAAVCLENATLYAELLDAAEFNTSVLRSLASGLMVVDLEERVVRVNQAALEIFNKPETALINKPLAAHAELAPVRELVAVTLATGRTQERSEVEVPGMRPEKVTLGLTVTSLSDHTGRPIGALANFRNLAQIRKLQDQVRRSQELAALGQMAAGVAHEIRNPLNSVRGFAQLIAEQIQSGKELGNCQEFVRIILEEVARTDRIIQDLLDFSSQRELVLAPLPLEPLLTELAKEMGPQFEESKVKLELRLPDQPLPLLRGHPDKLRQVFRNLLLNALQASRAEGRVELRAAGNPLTALAHGLMASQVLAVVVQDWGVGIAPEDLGRLFSPFFSRKERGTGLGLSICQKIVEQHGGRIEVQSTQGVGSAFTVCLPVPAGPAEES
jgi:signal transduction histidine kinase/pSer/pThr/pTyr-binding forkhead associated (FHA) protein